MRCALINVIVIGFLAGAGLQDAFGQQRQLRPVTLTYRPTPVIRTQWSPDSPKPATNSASGIDPKISQGSNSPSRENVSPQQPATAPKSANPFTPGFSRTSTSSESFNDVSSRPTNQQLQNASGGFHLSHSGFSQPASVAPNNYFGPEFHGWSNLQTRSGSLDSFESFNRFQPEKDSGGYFSPNTYVGPANNEWSNLSSGTPSPNDLGGWNYSP